MAAVAGLRGTGDWGQDERPKNFREMILWRTPNGGTPLTALMARVGGESVDDPEFSWWDEPIDIVRLRVDFAANYGTTETVITVDSADPSASAPANVWGVANHLKPGDLLMVEPAADNATFDHEVLRVVTVISDTSFTCVRGAAGTAAAAINNNVFLLLIGSSYAEGTPSPAATSRNPIKYFNYTQIFKTTYELTRTAGATRTRTGDPLANDKKRKAFDHARAIEFALMFGQRSEVTGENGKPQRTMAGIRVNIPAQNTTIFGGAPDTVNTFLDAVYRVFDFETPAGDERIALCGNVFLNELNKIIRADGSTQITFGPIIKQFGMNLREFVLPQGRLLLRTHPLMNRHSLYRESCFLLDFSALRWRFLKGGDTKFKDNIQGNDEDTRKGQWLTEAGLEWRYGGLTMGYLGSLSAT